MQDFVQNLFVTFWPNGGQDHARRNAWSAMVADTKRARERTSADAVVQRVVGAQEAARTPVAAGR